MGALAAAAFALALAGAGAAPAGAEETVTAHGLSAFGDLKYGPEFRHFDYVNPEAPKGGAFSQVGTQRYLSFDNLNPYVLKGDPAQGALYMFDTLMARAMDEPDAVYGLVAESVEYPPDKSWIAFELNPDARFSDGSLVTADDVVFSFEIIKEKGHPFLRQPLAEVEQIVAEGKTRVRFDFADGAETRDLALLIASQYPILSRHWWTGRDFAATTLEPPLGSGPYQVEAMDQGRSIVYARNPDYWGRDLPVNRGRFNFDRLRYEYFRDRVAQFEGFKADQYDFREEFTSKVWATEYNFPAVEKGWVKTDILPDATPSGVQGFFINTRRPHLADARVRRALDLAFDFGWSNKNIFYGLYHRSTSFFQGSDLAAEPGPPTGAVLEILERYRDALPEEVFEAAYVPPESDGSGDIRRHLRAAQRLLREAGWRVEDNRLVDGGGRPFRLEILYVGATFERVLQPYARNLERLGIEVSLRQVDSATYERRYESFDFDVTISRYVHRNTPGVELRNYWGSEAADFAGSRNIAGIKDPVVDALIEELIAAPDRDALRATARALDRVLRAGNYWVSNWAKAAHTIAYWDRFSRPETKPDYDRGVEDIWWFDEAKAAALAAARGE